MARAAPEARQRADSIADAIAEALRARGTDATRPAPVVEPPTESAALALALDAYANLRPADARTMLDALLARADTSGARGLERAELLDALLTLSLACRALGDTPAADAALDRALAIDPALAPALTQFPPTLVDALAARRAVGAGGGQGVIVLAALPEGGRVFVDAQAVAPATERVEVARGTHLLRVEAPGRVAWSARVEVGDAPVDARPELPPDASRLLREPGRPGERPDDELDRAARSLGARALVVDVSTHRGVTTVRVRDLARARVTSATVPTDVSADEAARDLLRRLEPPGLVPTIAEPGGSSALPWIAVAGGAVAVAITVVAIVLATSGSNDPSGFLARGER